MMVSWIFSAPGKETWPLFFHKRSGVHYLLLQALNQQIQGVSEPATLLEGIAGVARRALNPSGCIIWLRAGPSGYGERGAPWIGARPPPCLVDSGYEHDLQRSILPVAELKDNLLRTALREAGMSLVALMIHHGEVIGWLGVGPPRQDQAYTWQDQCFLEVLAGLAAMAIYSLRLKTRLETSVSQLRRAYQQIIQARENERRQLAEMFHDETLQHLADLSVRLGLLHGQNKIDPATLGDLQTRLARADRCLREIVRGIHPAVLSDLGLIEAVIAYLETLPLNHRRSPARIELCVTGFKGRRLPDQGLELALYRFTQNATTNALTHGKPRQVRVEFDWDLDSVAVRVKDDGCGMNITVEEAARAGHFGLLTMRERIKAFGGRFVSFSKPGRGTQITGWIPLTTPSPAPGQVELYTFEPAQSRAR